MVLSPRCTNQRLDQPPAKRQRMKQQAADEKRLAGGFGQCFLVPGGEDGESSFHFVRSPDQREGAEWAHADWPQLHVWFNQTYGCSLSHTDFWMAVMQATQRSDADHKTDTTISKMARQSFRKKLVIISSADRAASAAAAATFQASLEPRYKHAGAANHAGVSAFAHELQRLRSDYEPRRKAAIAALKLKTPPPRPGAPPAARAPSSAQRPPAPTTSCPRTEAPRARTEAPHARTEVPTPVRPVGAPVVRPHPSEAASPPVTACHRADAPMCARTVRAETTEPAVVHAPAEAVELDAAAAAAAAAPSPSPLPTEVPGVTPTAGAEPALAEEALPATSAGVYGELGVYDLPECHVERMGAHWRRFLDENSSRRDLPATQAFDLFTAWLRARIPPAHASYPLDDDTLFFFETIIKVSNARKHESVDVTTARAHLARHKAAVRAHDAFLQSRHV